MLVSINIEEIGKQALSIIHKVITERYINFHEQCGSLLF